LVGEAPPQSLFGVGCRALVVGGCGFVGMTFAALIVLTAGFTNLLDVSDNRVAVPPPPKATPAVGDNSPPETKRGEPTTGKGEIGPQPPKEDKLALARAGLHDLDPKVRQASVTAIGDLGTEGGGALGDF